MSFFRNFYRHHKRKKKTLFGGEIKSKEEISKLSARIKAHEKKEALHADNQLQEDLKKI